MVVISTTEFNTKQKKYFDLAKKENVAIKRGKHLFLINFKSKLEEDYNDWVTTPAMMAKYDKMSEDALNGINCTTCNTIEEAHRHFQTL